MIQRIRFTLKFISYLILSKHKKGHGIHSPFLYNLISKVFNNSDYDENLNRVFIIYNRFRKSKQLIEFEDFGAGSKYSGNTKSLLRDIIRNSSVNQKYGKLLYKLNRYFKCKYILELGSSVGISSAFIAQANKNAHFTSIEGSRNKLTIAKQIAQELNQNTKFIEGNIDHKLDEVLQEFEKIDFVYFDGNHTNKSTLSYFNSCLPKVHNNSVFVFDDIHWSKEMEEAWEEIKHNKKVKLSVDLYRMGLIFFKKELSKEHYVIKF